MADATKYLIIIQLKETTPARLATVVPSLQAELARMSDTAPELVLRSATADCFAFFIRSILRPGQIMSQLTAPGSKYSSSGMILDGRDSILTMEIGQSFHATDGFSRAMTWLQRH
jgi:hypothetical protein